MPYLSLIFISFSFRDLNFKSFYIKLRTFYKNYIYLIINSLRLHSKSHQKSLFLEVFGLVGKNNFIKLA